MDKQKFEQQLRNQGVHEFIDKGINRLVSGGHINKSQSAEVRSQAINVAVEHSMKNTQIGVAKPRALSALSLHTVLFKNDYMSSKDGPKSKNSDEISYQEFLDCVEYSKTMFARKAVDFRQENLRHVE